VKASTPPPLPYDGFPLRPHQNGHWFKSVWNHRLKKSEQFYFGSWHDDLKGERAIKDPQIGWLARRDAIKAGIDNVRVDVVNTTMSLGSLMAQFLAHKQQKAKDGELSLTTLGDYLREVTAFVTFEKSGTPAGGLRPEHFTAYMKHLSDDRKLGRPARKRVRAYITAFLRFGAKNGWITMPNTGVDWVAPATDPDAMRVAKARAGVKDYSDRILTGEEIDKFLARSQPAFKAIILLGVNCGLGPADIGRLRWEMIDLERGRLVYPRHKTGVARRSCLWKKTREALKRVRTLKHNRLALQRDGDASLVFTTRTGLPCYREKLQHRDVEIAGVKVRKLVGVDTVNTISGTFSRMARELGLAGVSFYRLRHTLKTTAKRARDREAIDVVMGHKTGSGNSGNVYDHEQVSWRRLRHVSKAVHRRLWPRIKPKEEKTGRPQLRLVGGSGGEPEAA
jgi:integrase